MTCIRVPILGQCDKKLGWPLKPSIPNAIPINKALEASVPLHDLLQRMRLSEDRLKRLSLLIPRSLHGQLRAGPADADNWTVLVKSPAVAAKLRQLLPTIATDIQRAESRAVSVRVKVSQ